MRVIVLSLDPRARFGTVLIFQPAVGIGDGDPVQRFGNVVTPGNRRFRNRRATGQRSDSTLQIAATRKQIIPAS
jgi:hypothetical protein